MNFGDHRAFVLFFQKLIPGQFRGKISFKFISFPSGLMGHDGVNGVFLQSCLYQFSTGSVLTVWRLRSYHSATNKDLCKECNTVPGQCVMDIT